MIKNPINKNINLMHRKIVICVRGGYYDHYGCITYKRRSSNIYWTCHKAGLRICLKNSNK
jgi:hypothetical protein